MSPKLKTALNFVLVCVISVALLLPPLVGALFCVKYRQWLLAILAILLFFAMKRVVYAIENRLGIRSPGNPESRIHGSGITIVPPWLRHRKEWHRPDENESDDITTKEK